MDWMALVITLKRALLRLRRQLHSTTGKMSAVARLTVCDYRLDVRLGWMELVFTLWRAFAELLRQLEATTGLMFAVAGCAGVGDGG